MDVLQKTIGHQILFALGMAEFAIAAAARPGDARFGVNYDVAGLDKLVGQSPRQRGLACWPCWPAAGLWTRS